MIEIFINDDIREFEKAFLDKIKENNIYFDRYCLLSCLYLFDCKKILHKYKKLLIKNFNKSKKDLGFDAQIDREFCKLAKINIKFYTPSEIPSPIEILLLKRKFKKAVKLQQQLGADDFQLNRTKQLIENNDLNKVIIKEGKLKKAPLTKKQKLSLFATCLCVFIAVLVSSIFIGNYIHLQSGLIYKYNESYQGYLVSCGKFYNPDLLQIPDEFNGKPVVGIEDRSFNNKSRVKKIEVGSNIKFFAKNTFLGCENLEIINLTNNSYLTREDFESVVDKKVALHFFYNLNLYFGETLFKTIKVEQGQFFDCICPTKAGYSFVGWADEDNSLLTDENGHSKSEYPFYNTVNLYSNFVANSNKIIFDGNGETSGQMPEQTIQTDQSEKLIENKFERAGYAFVGWAESKNGNAIYDDQALYTMGTNSTYTLYAVWEANENSIIFQGNGETSGSMPNQKIKTDKSANLIENTFEKLGYSFAGWSTLPGGGVEYQDQALYTMGSNSTYTLYAVWEANENTIIFQGNGETSGTMPDQKIKTDQTANLLENRFAKVGYTFAGWAESQNGDVVYYDQDLYSMGTNSTYTLYAVWEANENKIIFQGNGNTSGEMSEQKIKTDQTANLIENAFERKGYTFAGWASLPDGKVEYQNQALYTMGPSSTYYLYAVWEANENILIFDGNNFTSGEMANQSAKTDQTVTLNKNQYKREGYSFVGWSTSPDGEVEYADGDYYTMGPNSTYTLYAIWELGNIYFIECEQNLIDLVSTEYNQYDEIRLMKDLDFGGEEISSFYYFTTKFNGNHHTISNFKLNDIGFFGITEGAYIKNLGLCNINLTYDFLDGTSSIGGLIGRSANTIVESCYTTGNIYVEFYTVTKEDTRATVGGLIGELDKDSNATIKNCYSSCDVVASVNRYAVAGGLIGGFTAGAAVVINIENCYASGNVTTHSRGFPDSEAYSGGLIGYINEYSSSNGKATVNIKNCFATGNLESYVCNSYRNGGLAASISNVNLNITDCYYYSGIKYTHTGNISYEEGGYGQSVDMEEILEFIYSAWSGDIWELSLTELPKLK